MARILFCRSLAFVTVLWGLGAFWLLPLTLPGLDCSHSAFLGWAGASNWELAPEAYLQTGHRLALSPAASDSPGTDHSLKITLQDPSCKLRNPKPECLAGLILIWGAEPSWSQFHSLAPMYYRGSAAAVIVYDITKQDSFHTLKKWVKELKEHGPENIVMAIAGNKCDLSDIREVPLKDAKEYAESIGALVVETSAKNAVNIEELFQGISRQIPPLDPHENGSSGGIKLGNPSLQASRRCC